jgi:AcrR family transcriptional regulator
MNNGKQEGCVVTVSEPLPELPPTPLKRRDRLRAATTTEIIATARRLLLESGPQGISLRAIAREMGMTAPGLYRYFDDREELIRHVIADIFNELHDEIETELQAKAVPPDADPEDVHMYWAAKMVAACRAFRSWGLAHPGEFGMVFGVPLPTTYPDGAQDDIASACATRFASLFFGLFIHLWETVRFPIPSDDEIDPALMAQLGRHVEMMHQGELPAGAHVIFLRCWTALYGAVALEVFGHLNFALENPEPLFEYVLSDLAKLVGLSYPLES